MSRRTIGEVNVRPAIQSLDAYHPGQRTAGSVKLSSNENPRGCSPAVRDAVSKVMEDVHFYPDGAAQALRSAIAVQEGVAVEQIIVGNGSDEILTILAGTYLDPGDSVLIGAHTFSQYRFSATLFGATVVTVPMPELVMRPGDFLARIQEDTKVVFLCSPNNPTGSTISQDELTSFLAAVPKDLLVVVDHAYIEYQEDLTACNAVPLISAYPNLVVLRTFSKIYGLANLRIGYGMAQASRIAEMSRVRSPFNVGGISQEAARVALHDREFVASTLKMNRQTKEMLEIACTDLHLPWTPSQGNFVMIGLPEPLPDASQVAAALAAQGFTVRGLASFGLPRHLRISLGTEDQMKRFIPVFRSVIQQLRHP